MPREMLYLADELFFSGTAVEVTPITSVDRIVVGNGERGPVTKALQDAFFGVVRGELPDRHRWLHAVHARRPPARPARRRARPPLVRVALGSDHAGFALKERLKRELVLLGHQPVDLGTFAAEPPGGLSGLLLSGRRTRGARRSRSRHRPRRQRHRREYRGEQGRGRARLGGDQRRDRAPHPAAQRFERAGARRAHQSGPRRGGGLARASGSRRRSRAGDTWRASRRSAATRPSHLDETKTHDRSWRDQDPEIAARIDDERRRQTRDARADRVGEFRQPRGARGARLGAHQQVRRGAAGQALLRRLRVRRRGREPGASSGWSGCSAPITPTCSRTRAPRRTSRRTSRSPSPATRCSA